MSWLKKHNSFSSDTMMLAVMVWLCALPLIGIFVLPYWGQAALISAGVLFILALLVCWGICGWSVYENNKS